MKVLVIGTGYVGLTTAVALAHLGHEVICQDTDPQLVARLQSGIVPIYEPGLDLLLDRTRGQIRFTTSLGSDEVKVDVALICVGTPSRADGDVELRYVVEAAEAVGNTVQDGARLLIVNKSTVPVGTAQLVELTVKRVLSARGVVAQIMVASNPEFLREGTAVADTLSPDRIIVGSQDQTAVNMLRELYAPILDQSFAAVPGVAKPRAEKKPIFLAVNPSSSELAKYAANTFLAMKISFANEISGLADRVGADITEVMHAVGLDARIGPKFLGAGVGWGGSCFRKDVRGLIALGDQYSWPMPLSKATIEVNDRQRQAVVDKLLKVLRVARGTNVAVWGLAFKPNTDDLRDAPAIDIIRRLAALGVKVSAFDPVAMPRVKEAYPDLPVVYAESALDAARGADALILLTEWDLFLRIDWADLQGVMRRHVVIDGRNVLPMGELKQMGFTYVGMGR